MLEVLRLSELGCQYFLYNVHYTVTLLYNETTQILVFIIYMNIEISDLNSQVVFTSNLIGPDSGGNPITSIMNTVLAILYPDFPG